MNIMWNKGGISLIALITTIIVLLILSGVSLNIFNNLIIDKTINASTKTIESILKENIELAYIDCETSYLIDSSNISKKEYFKSNFEGFLNNVDNLIITEKENGFCISFKYKNEDYKFLLSDSGEANCMYLLKGNVKVGDYIEYNIEYTDEYSKEIYTSKNGWRVIDDGTVLDTSDNVKIISTKIPVKWDYKYINYSNNVEAVNKLLNDFENLELIDSTNRSNIFGSYFKIDGISEKVSTLTLKDFNKIYNHIFKTDRAENDISDVENIDDLLFSINENAHYWLATNNLYDSQSIYYITDGKIKSESQFRIGIRPVIYLKNDLYGIYESGVWKIIK